MESSLRMQQFAEGIFTKLSLLKRQRQAAGLPVIDLSVGTPNIPPAPHVMAALAQAAADPAQYVYAISDRPQLRQAVADWYRRRYQVTLDPDHEILSLMGSQDGLAHLALALVDPGDTVLVPDPCYPIFADGPKLAGARLAYLPLRPEHDYVIQLRDIPTAVARQAKLMVVSYPNNPTTALAPPSFYRELIEFARQYNILVAHDNAYSELIFDGSQGKSFLAYPGARELGVEFNSLSKTYGLAGARIGFCLGNADIIAEMKRLKSNLDYGMFLPIQKAAIAAISGDQSSVGLTRQAYASRAAVLCDGLTQAGWPVSRPRSTMFVWANIPARFTSSEAFALELFDHSGVLVTPGSAFGPSGEGHVRMALVQDETVLAKACQAVAASGLI
ncbi:MAG: aminotransferase class I/II-fold pyridoxal phosphate-dependent enzyme [Oscillospiraceae bacterium]|nr:aminotransferase class I/II-fold pyridoxal phosphate-dependent enzyme [Oscillospiraceae bacterium]MDD4368924.1 aminotransferase class I/II-fold pyridoxal phosphate-dependent enzyme [Oscillospiraceae bacterium]